MAQRDDTKTAREALVALTVAAEAEALPPDMPAVVRTDAERFEGLAGFAFEPRYRELGGLRLAHVDEGEGPPVVFLHGSPTWSYLWRNVIPVVRDAGYRCIAPDQVGYGRSDKPTELRWYTYDRYVETDTDLLERLDLRWVTLVLHDWSAPVGLRIAAEQPGRISRLVVMNGTLALGQPPTQAWQMLRDFIEQTPDLPIGGLVRAGCHEEPTNATVRLRGAVPRSGVQVRTTRRAAAAPNLPSAPRRAPRTGGTGRAPRGRSAEASAMGRARSDHADQRRREPFPSDRVRPPALSRAPPFSCRRTQAKSRRPNCRLAWQPVRAVA
jgi:pimeloyl-ACP methyl ester carboxylesterase